MDHSSELDRAVAMLLPSVSDMSMQFSLSTAPSRQKMFWLYFNSTLVPVPKLVLSSQLFTAPIFAPLTTVSFSPVSGIGFGVWAPPAPGPEPPLTLKEELGDECCEFSSRFSLFSSELLVNEENLSGASFKAWIKSWKIFFGVCW